MKESIRKSFWFNLAVVLVLCAILYTLFFATLHWVTRHGEEVKIPDVRGKNMDAAIAELKGMHFEIYVDSTYEPAMKPLSVLKQVPDTGSVVKEGRTVFITVNMLTPPRIPMPNLVNLSYRSAEMLLRNNKLMVGDTTYKPDIASGAILSQLYNGTPIRPGELVSQGSKISLVIGNGLGNTEWNVPEVTGSTVDEAITILNQFNVQPVLHAANDMEQITDTSTAIVVDQLPTPGNHARIKMGEAIDLIIMQNPQPEEIHHYNTDAPSDVITDDKDTRPKDNTTNEGN
jgi:beta-lactam-binding protein with PASTA domain